MLVLDEKSIDAKIRAGGAVMVVLFYADWCPFCRKFKPVFETYERSAKHQFAEAKVNEDENPMWDRFKVEVVPTVVSFKDGREVARRNGKPGMGLSKSDMESILGEVA